MASDDRADNRALERLRLELAWFTGQPWLALRRTSGAGAILRLQRVRPRQGGAFTPLRSDEITPKFLDSTLRALKRWKFDIVGMDEVCRRAMTSPERRRFVALTFDGAYKDFITEPIRCWRATAFPSPSIFQPPFPTASARPGGSVSSRSLRAKAASA